MNVQQPDFYFDANGLSDLKNAARSDGRDPETLRKVASQFEGLYLNMVLKSMREATPESGLFDSDQTRFFRDMHDQQLTTNMASKGGIGLTDLLVRQLGGQMGAEQAALAAQQTEPAALDSRAMPMPETLPAAPRRYRGMSLQPQAAPRELTQPAQSGFLPLDKNRVDSRWLSAPATRIELSPIEQGGEQLGEPRPLWPSENQPLIPLESPTSKPLIESLPAEPFRYPIELEIEPDFSDLPSAAAARVATETPQLVAVARPIPNSAPAVPVAASDTPATRELRGPWQSPNEFVREIWPHAQRAAEKLGVSPRAIVAQSALETGWGRKLPLREDGSVSFNLFGIKADQRWAGERLRVDTLEFEGSEFVSRREPFRAYGSLAEAVDDYADFLQANPRYRDALAAGDDERAFAEALQAAGYATDPAYARKISRIASGDTLANALAEVALDPASEDRVALKSGSGKPTRT